MVNAAAAPPTSLPGPGISETLARERSANISALGYDISFNIPAGKTEPVRGSATIRLKLRAPARVVLDFDQPRDRVRSIRVGGKPVAAAFANSHLTIRAAATKAGENAIAIEFIAGDEALNRNDDFLYTLFVPARAHLAFPCFDQPDLKAHYALTLEVPSAWQAVSNGAEIERVSVSDAIARIRFAETPPLPTYLFAFAAGRFSIETAMRNGRTFRMFHRETDAQKVARNRDALFDLHARALAWLEEYTGIPYPWGKFDFVLIPAFQFGGMEHAGAVFYNASSMMLDESATQNQLLSRASTIAHETAHMWFGDLVTMRWFNDVWMKEVMANFMAARIVNPSFPNVNHDLRFLLAHYPAAYSVDRTAGANPIRQPLANLSEAGALYGNIIYDKAPVVMRQLELMVGEQGFRDGLREYLKRYSFSNASWLDLVHIFDTRTGQNVSDWSRVWVERRGRPVLKTELQLLPDGKISRLAFTQSDPLHRGLVWPERLKVALGYPDRAGTIPVSVTGRSTEVVEARNTNRPLYVLPNGEGLGYGLFVLDGETRRYLIEHMEDIHDPLTRGSAWVDLWEDLLEGTITPHDFLGLITRALPLEDDVQNTQLVLSDLSSAFWLFLPQSERVARAPALEAFLRDGLSRAKTASQKAAWFGAFRDTALTPAGLAWLERVWKREETVEGLPLAETDEIGMALELAVRGVPDSQAILTAQRDRTLNPDRKARFEFVMPALSADPAVRDQAFQRLRTLANRRHEPWAIESLHYLNHPLREADALHFIRPSLELLPEVQRTGDIFFPQRWMDAALWGHRSPAAARIVRDFLSRHSGTGRPDLVQRLQWTVLTAADDLFRVSALE
jgi:aminopeptidase N